MVKKRTLLLALLLGLVLVLLPGALAAREQPINVFSVEADFGVPHDGYLFSFRDGRAPRIMPLSADIEQVADNIYLADSVEEIARFFDGSQLLYIEPNFEIVLDPGATELFWDGPIDILANPNDPFFPRQWCMAFINARALWDLGLRGAGVRVGVIDSGLVSEHEDLDPRRVAAGFNFLDNNADVTDVNGHGTQVAGVIAATRNNGLGVAGLTDHVTIVPFKVFEGARSNLSYAIRAMNDAYRFDVDVLNLSWGIPQGATSRALIQAVDRLVEQGIIVVAAAGNYGNTTMVHPAALPNVISVGALDENGNVASFSQRNVQVTVTAPGVDIATLGHARPNSYVATQGTSFSAPFVSAMAAVAKSVDPNIDQAQFMDLLQRSAISRGGFNASFGHGTVCMNRFLAVLPGVVWFNDISTHWARADILNVAELGLFGGVGGGAFAPNQAMNRAMFVTVLGRLYREMGGNVPNRAPAFVDNPQIPTWARPYVAWASTNGLVTGFPGNRFQPLDAVTRAQAATFLARFANHLGMNATGNPSQLNRFVDGASVPNWARPYMAWTAEREIITGISAPGGLALRPQDTTTRAQVAVLLERFMNSAGIRLSAVA